MHSGNLDAHIVAVQEIDRRRHERIPIAAPAQVISLHSYTSVNCNAQLTDVSISGIGLAVGVEIPRDVLVKIVLDTAIIFGEVRHCSAVADEPGSFKVGIEIETVVFRGGDQNDWSLALRVLWAKVSLGVRSIIGHHQRHRNA